MMACGNAISFLGSLIQGAVRWETLGTRLVAIAGFHTSGAWVESVYYGINNTRPIYSERVIPSFTKSLSFVLIGPILNKIQPFKIFKICKEMYGFPDKCPQNVWISTSVRQSIHLLLNFYVFEWLYLVQYWRN